MPKKLSFAVLSILLVALFAAFDHYLFVRRISAVDPKSFYHQLQVLTAAHTDQERRQAMSAAELAPELRDYQVTLVSDHVVLLRTHSLTSYAYLAFYQIGASNAWSVGWVRRGRFSPIGTLRL
ncbi:MAG TPA: hypothetical protein VJS88_04040 [Chthoniobacterales bacterium]|nr:hypothetical protein [Chthoniobacterales bacterium]